MSIELKLRTGESVVVKHYSDDNTIGIEVDDGSGNEAWWSLRPPVTPRSLEQVGTFMEEKLGKIVEPEDLKPLVKKTERIVVGFGGQ